MTAPTLSGFSSTISFDENIVNATPQLLDASVTFTDPDNDFDGGFLILSGLLAEDRVSVRNQGSGAGQIGFDPVTGVVTYGGVQIGTLAGGVGSTLTITFNAAATSAAIDALIQNLTYANISDTPTASRAFALDVVDASGAGLASSVDALTLREGAANPFNGVDYGQFSNPSLFDYDSDGDLDLVLGGQANSPLRLFRNDNGADTFTEQMGAANPFAALGAFDGFIAPRFGDIDGDGDKDLVLGVHTGQTIRTFRNDGGAFTELTGANNPFAGAFGDGYPIPAFADIDGDGDEDAVFGKGDGTFVLYRNENDSLAFTRVAQGSNPLGGIDVGQYSAPSFVDLDADGDLDFVAGRSAAGVACYRNDGGVFTALTGANNPLAEVTASDSVLVFGDIDGNGAADLIIGQTDGTLTVYTNAKVTTVNVTAQNDASVNTVPSTQTTAEDVALVFSTAGGNAIQVSEAEGGSLTVTLTATNGSFSLSGVAGLSFTAGDGTGDQTATFSGTLAAINAALNGLSFAPRADFHGVAGLTINTSDGALSDADTVAINVTAVNDAPVEAANVGATVDEGAAVVLTGAMLDYGDIEQADADIEYIVTSLSNGALTLNGVALGVGDSFTQADIEAGRAAFAHDGSETSSAGFGFDVSDGQGGSVTGQVFDLDVNPVNDAPEGADVTRATDEDTTYTFLVSDFGITDAEGDGLASVLITALPTGGTLLLGGVAIMAGAEITLAAITAGDLIYIPAANAYGTGADSFTFQVRDDGGTAEGGADLDATANSFTFDIAPVNDAPTEAVNAGATVDEGAAVILTGAMLDHDDLEQPDADIAYTITSLSNGALTLNGVALGVGDSFTQADIEAGLVEFTHDGSEASSAGFGFDVSDGQGGSVTGQAFDINVTPVNDAPANAIPGAQTTAEDTVLVFSAAAGNAIQVVDGDNGSLTVTLTATNGTFSLSGLTGLSFTTGDGIGDATATFSGTLVDINAALEGISFEPTANFNGGASLALDTDDGDASDADTVAINVTAVNDAPTEAVNAGATVDEGAAVVLTGAMLDHDDVEQADADIEYTVTSLSNGSLTMSGVALAVNDTFTQADIEAGRVAFTHDGSETASAGFGFDVSDGQGGAVSGQAFDIDVSPVNDAPAGTDVSRTIDEDAAYTFLASDFGIADAEGDGLASVLITALPAGGTLLLDGVAIMAGDEITVAQITAGDLTYQPAADANGTGAASFTFQVRDDGGTAEGGADLDATANSFTFDIAPVNDAPTEAVNAGATVDEGAAVILTGAMLDHDDLEQPDADIAYTITSLSNGALTLNGVALGVGDSFTQADIEAGLVEFTHDGSEASSAGFGFDVSDGQGGTVTGQAFAVDVTPINDAPSGADVTRTIGEDATYVFLVSDFSIADAEGDSLVSVLITALPAGGTLLLDDVAITAGDEITLAQITAGHLTYQPAADANGTGAASFTFQVRDDGGTMDGGVDLDPSADAFTFDITPVNDAPTEAVNAGATVDEGAAVVLTGAMLDHDDLEQADADIVYTVTSAANGALTLNGVALGVGDSFTQADIENGLAAFTHDGSETTSAAFGFDVSDGQGGAVTGQAFDIDVSPIDDAPTAANDAVSVLETGTASGSVFADNGSGEDSDPEGLSVIEVDGEPASVGQQITLGSGALLTLNADGTYAYDPNGAFNLAAPGSGASNITATDSFTYTLAGGAVATVTITVQGQDGDDLLEGTAGDDALNGGLGADRMEGGLGDDTYYVGNLGDRVVELRGQGNDQVFSSVNFNAQKQGAVVETITLTGTARTAIGDVFANTLIGNASQNILNGYKGADTMEGRGGNDIYTVDNVGDVVIELENAGTDRINSAIDYTLGDHLENLTLLGGADLAATGNDGLNHVVGNRGDNVITGGGGLDFLTGGLGSDTFVYTSVSDTTYGGYDRIMDLDDDDTIDLSQIDANANTTDVNEAFVLVDRYSRTAGEMILTSGNGLTFLVGDTDGDGKSDFRIALIGDHADFDNILG